MGSMFSLNFDASVNSSYQSEIALGFSRWDEIVSGIKSPGGDIPHQITVNISSDSGITAAAIAITTGLQNVNGLFYPTTVQLKIKEQNLPRLLSTKIPTPDDPPIPITEDIYLKVENPHANALSGSIVGIEGYYTVENPNSKCRFVRNAAGTQYDKVLSSNGDERFVYKKVANLDCNPITDDPFYIFRTNDTSGLSWAYTRLSASSTFSTITELPFSQVSYANLITLFSIWDTNSSTWKNQSTWSGDFGLGMNNSSNKTLMSIGCSTSAPLNSTPNPPKTLLYYLSLHESCHLLGVGNLWSSRNLLKDFLGDTFYIGSNAVREYKTAFSNWPDSSNFFGVPVEDGGGLGTEGTHPEEGHKSDPGNLPHYLLNNSIIYPGLEGEIMTGWLENKAMPLSRISIAFLEDLNYSVDYSKADNFFVAHDPPATPTPRTPTPLPPETPTKTSTPNAGVTAITPTPRLPPSNFTPYNSIVSKYLEKSNVLKSSNHLNRSNSLKENL